MNNLEIKNKILDLKKQLLNLRIKKSMQELSDTSHFNKIKKEIARLFTQLNSYKK